jgi:hypothetical protein
MGIEFSTLLELCTRFLLWERTFWAPFLATLQGTFFQEDLALECCSSDEVDDVELLRSSDELIVKKDYLKWQLENQILAIIL